MQTVVSDNSAASDQCRGQELARLLYLVIETSRISVREEHYESNVAQSWSVNDMDKKDHPITLTLLWKYAVRLPAVTARQ